MQKKLQSAAARKGPSSAFIVTCLRFFLFSLYRCIALSLFCASVSLSILMAAGLSAAAGETV
jgi:hypothetical protein